MFICNYMRYISTLRREGMSSLPWGSNYTMLFPDSCRCICRYLTRARVDLGTAYIVVVRSSEMKEEKSFICSSNLQFSPMNSQKKAVISSLIFGRGAVKSLNQMSELWNESRKDQNWASVCPHSLVAWLLCLKVIPAHSKINHCSISPSPSFILG